MANIATSPLRNPPSILQGMMMPPPMSTKEEKKSEGKSASDTHTAALKIIATETLSSEQLVTKVKQVAQQQREEKLKQIEKLTQGKTDTFLETYKKIETHLLELLKSLTTEKSNNSFLDKWTQHFTTNFLDKSVYNFLNDKGISLELVSDMPDITYEFMVERILNSLVNQKLLSLKIQLFIEANLENILKKFEQSATAEKITVEVTTFGGETHNVGRIPHKVQLMRNGQSFFQFVCKPREVLADSQLLKLFSDIKAANGARHLPVYTIFHPEEGWPFFHNIGEVSLWEFIEGPTSKALPKSGRSSKEDIIASDILYLAGASDLNNENFISSTKYKMLVPIDLEARQSSNDKFEQLAQRLIDNNESAESIRETAKQAKKELDELTDRRVELFESFNETEKKLLKTVRQERAITPYRFCPATGTDGIVKKTNLYVMSGQLDPFYAAISKELTTENCTNIQAGLLKACLIWDTFNGDVPYFTHHKKDLFYGLRSFNAIVASK